MQFPPNRVSFLGHIISESGVEVDPEKVRAVERMKKPSSLKDVSAFLWALCAIIENLFRVSKKQQNLFTGYQINQKNLNGVQSAQVR